MFNLGQNRRPNLFQTKVVVQKEEELPKEELPIEEAPKTRKEAKELNKYRYLPAERLQIKLNKQLQKEKKKNKLNRSGQNRSNKNCSEQNTLSKEDVNNISRSIGKITSLLEHQ
jgi:hypothetical protein